MSVAAVRITATERIDKTETYNRNAPALPSSSTPQKSNIGDRMVDGSQSAHQPHHQYNHDNGSNNSVTKQLTSPCILKGNVYASLQLWECRFNAILYTAAPNMSPTQRRKLAPEMHIQQGGLTNMSSNEFTYFGIGAALGVAAAVLLAPKSGPETRKFLRSTADESADYLASRAADARDTASQAINRGKKVIKQSAENLTAAVDAGVQTFREAVQTTP
jgi:gas vesicle protein